MTKKLYIISGLGVDERVFQKLNFSGFSTTFIKWTLPLENESIEDYATRLLNQIQTPRPIIIGLSFGGIIAVEIAKQIETEKIILIASAKTKNEIPPYFRIAGQLRLHKLLPTSLLKKANTITNWLFGAKSTFDRELLKQILIDTDPRFLKWAIDKIVRWANLTKPETIFHIHGTSDRILPIRYVDFDHKILSGGHLMTLNKAEELTEMLRRHV